MRIPPRLSLCALAISMATCGASLSQLPSGDGIAAKHPADRDLHQHSAVLLHENFETGSLKDLSRQWSDISNEGGKVLAFSPDQPAASGGKRSLQMTATLGENTGGHLYTPLPREVETVFARFYVKFAADAQYVHHFVHLGGYRPATKWPQGGAGSKPRGDERFTVGIEPHGAGGRHPAPGEWVFYPYWTEMKASVGNRYWGNSIPAVTPALVPRERWQCVEIMLRCNTSPEKSDGELALWLDGKLSSHIAPGTPRGPWTGMGFQPLTEGGEPFEGFRWRTDAALKVNFFWLLFYVTENAARQNKAAPDAVNRVWFDDIVVADEYIGPARERSAE